MGRNLFQYHPKIGYTFIPGLKARIEHEDGGYLVKTNNAGFRCNNDVTVKKSKKIRIIVFGDSYTAGDGVSNKFRFSDLIEQKLEDTEVLNFGLSGTGTDQQYLAWQEFAKSIEYDLLVICPLAENIRRNMAKFRVTRTAESNAVVAKAKPYFELTDSGLKLGHVPCPKKQIPEKDFGKIEGLDSGGRYPFAEQMLSKHAAFLKDPVQKLMRYQPFPEYENPKSDGWLLTKAIIEQWKQENNKKVLICPVPVYQYIEKIASPDAFQARYKEVSGVDILPEFWKLSKDKRRKCRFKVDQHPTKLGHSVIAKGMIKHIRKIL